jgi:hypothetical protein
MLDFDATCRRCDLRFRSHYIWVIHMDEHDKDERIKELESKLEGYQTLLAKIGKKMNDPLLSQRERIMIAEDIRRQLEAPQETKP